MITAIPPQQVGTCNRSQVDGFGGLCPLVIALVILLMSYGLLTNGAQAADRSRPVRIGVLTSSWGPTPGTAGLRDGLLELGYHEREDFVLGIRFTKGDNTALPGAARQLVQYGADLIFTDNAVSAKAAQEATTQIPIVFSSLSNPMQLNLIQTFARPGGNLTGRRLPRWCCFKRIASSVDSSKALRRYDGLLEFGYREDIGFCCSVCFTSQYQRVLRRGTRVGAIRVDLNHEVYSESTGSSSGGWVAV